MSHRRHSASAMDTIARIVFPEVKRTMRRKHLRLLMLSLLLGSLFCAVLVWLLWLVQR